MVSNARRFLGFHLIFWLVAGAGLFVSGLTQMPVVPALVRNAFLAIAGFLTAFSLVPLIDATRLRPAWLRRTIGYSGAYLVALFCVVVINAITYTQRGVAFEEIAFGRWFAGAMNFALVLAFWTELYLQRVFDPASPTREEGESTGDSWVLSDQGRMRRISFAEISHVMAAGDYVEVYLVGESRPLLERRTLSSLARELPDPFLRIHRSAIVNCDRVTAFAPLSKGRFRIELGSGVAVDSSRGYRDSIRARLEPQGL